jgi:hypothetical protein
LVDIPDIICKKFKAVLSPESIDCELAFISAIILSFLKASPSVTLHFIFAFLSICLKDSSNHRLPLKIPFSLDIRDAFKIFFELIFFAFKKDRFYSHLQVKLSLHYH